MKLSNLLYENEYIFSEVPFDTEIEKITTRTDEIDERTLLIIPNPERVDCLQEVPSAPVATVCDANVILPDNFPSIRVNNPRFAMANIFYRFEGLRLENTKIIGITGTNGKTSTAYFIKNILKSSGYRVGFIGTGKIEIDGKSVEEKYYSMTTPDPQLLYKSLRQMEEAGCNVIVMEVSSHSLALDKVAPLKFDYGVFTNLSYEHLDFHKTEEQYFLAKRSLIQGCKRAVINIDDSRGKELYNEFSEKSIGAGILWRADVWAGAIERKGLSGSSYMYYGKDFCYKVNLSVPGSYNVYNSMLAAAVCTDMGIKPCEVKRALESISSPPGRFEIIKDEITVIIDYAHTHAAFYNIMKELNQLKKNGRLCVIFGCGGERDKAKRPKMAEIAERYADRIIVTTDNSRNEDPKEIISDIIRGFGKTGYEVDEDRARAIRRAILTAEENDVIAVIGKGAEDYNIDKNGYSDFNEKEIIYNALSERKRGC